MYCIKCGVKLAETEKKCPLCNTVVYHPDLIQEDDRSLYPKDRMPKRGSGLKALNGAMIFLYVIPLLVCFYADFSFDKTLGWSGFVAGALVVSYVILALPLWFTNPNPVIFVPCSFAAISLYLWYIDFVTVGSWFFTFALPVVGGMCLITCTMVTLLRYLHNGRLYIIGGAVMAFGIEILLIELLLGVTFGLSFIGWSLYPLVVLLLLGGLLIYLAINRSAREILERKLFF